MKNKYACTIAATLLVSMITIIIVSGIYVKSSTEYILSILEESPEDVFSSTSNIREAADYWEGRRRILNLILSDPELDEISALFDELIIETEEANIAEYKKTMARLKRAIEDIKELEAFSIENIF